MSQGGGRESTLPYLETHCHHLHHPPDWRELLELETPWSLRPCHTRQEPVCVFPSRSSFGRLCHGPCTGCLVRRPAAASNIIRCEQFKVHVDFSVVRCLRRAYFLFKYFLNTYITCLQSVCLTRHAEAVGSGQSSKPLEQKQSWKISTFCSCSSLGYNSLWNVYY